MLVTNSVVLAVLVLSHNPFPRLRAWLDALSTRLIFPMTNDKITSWLEIHFLLCLFAWQWPLSWVMIRRVVPWTKYLRLSNLMILLPIPKKLKPQSLKTFRTPNPLPPKISWSWNCWTHPNQFFLCRRTPFAQFNHQSFRIITLLWLIVLIVITKTLSHPNQVPPRNLSCPWWTRLFHRTKGKGRC